MFFFGFGPERERIGDVTWRWTSSALAKQEMSAIAWLHETVHMVRTHQSGTENT